MATQDPRLRNAFAVPDDASSVAATAAAELGHRIARARIAKQLSQQELADRAGVSKNHLQVLERGWSDRAKRTPANPRLTTLAALCRELGGRVDVNYPGGPMIVFLEDEGRDSGPLRD